MRTISALLTAFVVPSLTIAFAQNVSYDYDRTVDFSRFKTYAWVRGTTVADELNHKRILAAVDAQLSRKGLSKVDTPARADVMVAYHATFDRNLQIHGFSSGWGGYRLGGLRSGTARAEEILVGTLVIDVVDAATKSIVWRGTAIKDVDLRASPQKREKSINRAAAKLFEKYPGHQ